MKRPLPQLPILFLAAAACGNPHDTAPTDAAPSPPDAHADGGVDGGGGVRDAAPAGSVTGVVNDARTGARLAGVTVSAATHRAITDAAGAYALEGLATGAATIAFARDGYAPGYARVELGYYGVTALGLLEPLGAPQDYDPTVDATLSTTTDAGPYAVIFGPDSLATTDTLVSVSITPLDPTRELAALPGNLALGGVMLTPLTFAEFSIVDGNGDRVNLKPDREAQVELPIPRALRATPAFALGQTIHCYAFDPATGTWNDFVVGHVAISSVDGVTPVVRASVKHFSWYGAAPLWSDCHDVSGTVVSQLTGAPLAHAQVVANPGTAAETDDAGHFTVTVPLGRGGDGPTFTAYQTFVDTDGSVSGTAGAKVIEYGTVPALTLVAGLTSTPCSSAPPGTPSELPPVRIEVGRLGADAYRADVVAAVDRISIAVRAIGPGGSPGAPAEHATATVIDPAGVPAAPINVLGAFTLNLTGAAAGDRYTLVIDADGDGVADGSGAVILAGPLAIAAPLDGSTQSATGLIVRWTDAAAAVPGYSAWYHVGIGLVTGGDRDDYVGNALQFAPTSQGGGAPLAPGHYAIVVQALPGPRAPIITGPSLSGAVSDTRSSPIVELDLTP